MAKQIIKPLSPIEKDQWNGFVDYLDKNGYKGNTALDNRDTNLGNFLFNKYKKDNPGVSLNYTDVPRIQQGLLDYRDQALAQIHAGKMQVPGMKSDDEFMPSLSPADGWLGSKTSSHKFPVAQATVNNNGNVTTTNYGTDTDRFLANNKQ